MYLSEPLKIAWVRVPKTASSSFYKATCDGQNQEIAKWKKVGTDHGELDRSLVPSGYKTLITIRNPYDWVRSICCMCAKTPHWNQYVEIEKETQPIPRSTDAFFTFFKKTQLDWVRNPETGEVEVDEVLCIENAGKFLSEHGMEPLEVVNKTPIEKTKSFEWTEERRIWVRRKFAAELKYYPDIDKNI